MVEYLATAGKPLSKVFRVKDAKNVWPSLGDLEVRAQLREGESTRTRFISDLHDFMTWVFDGNDLVINWIMTGAEVRDLHSKMPKLNRFGYFNLVVSDVGIEDARAVVVPVMGLVTKDITTNGGSNV